MTATEVLRRMLDEQGVGSYKHEAPAAVCLAFFDGRRWHDCWESTGGEVNVTFSMTPEQAIAATLGSCNCSNNCTNSERTGTCQADETDLIPFVRADSGDFEVDYIHVMECTECGHTYEHVNGDYEYCPRCGRKREDVSE